MDLDEILRIRGRIEDSRRRIAAALDAARASQRRMGEMRIKLERHRRQVARLQISLKLILRADEALIQGIPRSMAP
jgi:hypothetical protein